MMPKRELRPFVQDLPVAKPRLVPPEWIALGKTPPSLVPLGPVFPASVTASGVEEGYAEGLRRAQAEAQDLRTRATGAIAAALELRNKTLRDTEDDLIELALAIAREVTLDSVEGKRDLAATLSRIALSLLTGEDRVAIRCSKHDVKELETWIANLSADPSRPEVVLVEDPALGPGEIVADSAFGRVDARIEERLKQVARALREGNGFHTGGSETEEK